MVDFYGFHVGNIPYMDPMGYGTADHYGTVDIVAWLFRIYTYFEEPQKNIWVLRRDI